MSIVEDILTGLIGVLDSLIHNVLGIIFILVAAFFFYLKYFKPKPIDWGKEVFRKRWEATTIRLRLPSVKQLALCSYPFSIDDLRQLPMHQIQHQNIGNIIGINFFGIINNYESLLKFIKNPNEDTFKNVKEENKESIKDDTFWIAFACEKTTNPIPMFGKSRKTLLYAKMNQIINLNSSDNIIRIRGFGLTPIGDYEIINDENVNINRIQLVKDTTDSISEEVVLGAYSMLGKIVQEAIASDAPYRKDVAREGIKILGVPDKTTDGGTP